MTAPDSATTEPDSAPTEPVTVAIDPRQGHVHRLRLGRLRRWQTRYPLAQVGALVVVFLWGSATIDGYDSSSSMKSMLVLAALLGLSALPQTLVVLVGGLDLSVPGFIATGGVMTAQLSGTHHWSMVTIMIAIVVICGLLGGASGFLCHRFGANPLIISLGMYAVLEGGLLVWTKGNISGIPPASLSNWTSAVGTTAGISIPPVVVLWAGVAVIAGLVLSRMPAGRRSTPRAPICEPPDSRCCIPDGCGPPCSRSRPFCRDSPASLLRDTPAGPPRGWAIRTFFEGLAAVIVGGTALGSARGDYWRTVLGALILTALTTILVGKGFDTADTQILFGFIILVVVAGYGHSQRVRDRVLAAEADAAGGAVFRSARELARPTNPMVRSGKL